MESLRVVASRLERDLFEPLLYFALFLLASRDSSTVHTYMFSVVFLPNYGVVLQSHALFSSDPAAAKAADKRFPAIVMMPYQF